MSRADRLKLLAIAVILYAALGWSISVFAVGAEPAALAFFTLLGLPALLTAATAVLLRGTIGEVIGAAILSSALSGLALYALIVWIFWEGGIR